MSDVDKETDKMISPRHHSCKDWVLMWKLHHSQDLAGWHYFDYRYVIEAESGIDESKNKWLMFNSSMQGFHPWPF